MGTRKCTAVGRGPTVSRPRPALAHPDTPGSTFRGVNRRPRRGHSNRAVMSRYLPVRGDFGVVDCPRCLCAPSRRPAGIARAGASRRDRRGDAHRRGSGARRWPRRPSRSEPLVRRLRRRLNSRMWRSRSNRPRHTVRDGSTYPQLKLNLSKLTVTSPFPLSTKTVVSCAVIDEPSEPVAWIVSVNSLFWLRSFMLKLPHTVACPV